MLFERGGHWLALPSGVRWRITDAVDGTATVQVQVQHEFRELLEIFNAFHKERNATASLIVSASVSFAHIVGWRFRGRTAGGPIQKM